MYLSLFLISFVLTITLFLFSKVEVKLTRLLKAYRLLFLTVTFILAVLTSHHHQHTWWPVVKNTLIPDHRVDYVSATSLDKVELEPIIPLIDQFTLKESMVLSVPQIMQYPELPRGCEVTSLAMLLRYHDIEVDKMTLAAQVRKDPTPYRQTEDGISFGNPNIGFVGDMYNLSNPGFGVYHKPLTDLAQTYVGNDATDLTGFPFVSILSHINKGQPVLVIINTTFKPLPKHEFQTWKTPTGKIDITMKEHAVVITGYDNNYIYFNDPLRGKNKKAPLAEFQQAWVQMGKQAITITR